ncbi:MAG: single-stranded DNA-binding protein [Planctomycetes bacterium]|nr:single-stranded DNA-binding protein [Planctomycetota bacterium]
MATLNKVMLIGRLTDNPEPPRSLPNSGSTVVKFRFAVGRSKKNPQTGLWENDPNPLYIDCEVFSRPDSKRNLADLISKYAKKGDPLYIEGRLQFDQWEDKNGGGKRSKHKVVVDSVELLGGRNNADGGGGGGHDDGGGDDYEGGGGGRNSGGGGRSYGGGGSRPTNTGGRGSGSPPPSNNNNDDGGSGGDDPIPF